MITIQVFTSLMTNFYFSPYLFVASVIFGIMQCIKGLIYR